MFLINFEPPNEKGMSLAEMMIAVALTSLVMASAFQGYAMIVAAKNGSSAQVNAMKLKSMIILETAKPADCKNVLGGQIIDQTVGAANAINVQNLSNSAVIDYASIPNAANPNVYHEWVVSSVTANIVGQGSSFQVQTQTYNYVLAHLAFNLTARTTMPGLAANSTIPFTVPLVLVVDPFNKIASCSSQQSSLGKTQVLPTCTPGQVLLYGGLTATSQPSWWCTNVIL